MVDPSLVSLDPAYKLFISDIVNCEKSSNGWIIYFGNIQKPLVTFLIQVKVTKILGFNHEIMIVDDSTGKAKVTRSKRVPGDFSWVKVGSVCSIVGKLLEGGKLPHIDIVKMAEVDNPVQQKMWSLEVEELRNFFTKKIAPNINV